MKFAFIVNIVVIFIITDFRNNCKIFFGKERIYLYEKYLILRNEKGVTDYKVAIETGITQSTFTDWKSGRSKPKIDKLKRLAEYFGVEVGYFVE